MGRPRDRAGRRINDGESLAHALTNVGTALSGNGDLRGDDLLQEAVELALAEGFHDHAARAIVNLGWNRLARAATPRPRRRSRPASPSRAVTT